MKRVFQAIVLLSILLISSAVFAQKAKTNSGGVINSKAVKLPVPAYPAAALAVRASGAVNVRVTIDENGKVVSSEAVSGHPLLRKASEDAAMKAEFKPFIVAGKAAQVTGTLVYNFMPDGKVSNMTTKGKDGAKKIEDESADKEEKDDKAQIDSTGNTVSSSEKSNPAEEGQRLEGRYKSSRSMLYYTFHTDGTFVKATAGGTADSAYGTERPGIYYIQANTITLKFSDGTVDQFSFEILDNKDLKINGLTFWVWNN